jgi:hypothetical protein
MTDTLVIYKLDIDRMVVILIYAVRFCNRAKPEQNHNVEE